MSLRRTWMVALGAGAVVLGTTAAALACSAQPSPQVRFAPDQAEASARDVARDGAVVLRLDCRLPGEEWGQATVDAVCGAAFNAYADARVSVTPALGGEAVAGHLFPGAAAITFVPDVPLASDTEYRVVGTFTDRSGEGMVQTVSTTLRTSNALLPTFVSTEAPTLSAEWYDAPVAQCDQGRLVGRAATDALDHPFVGCPTANEHRNCRLDGTARTVRLHAKVGPLTGGVSTRPYSAALTLWRRDQGDDAGAATRPNVLRGDASSAESGGSIELFADLEATADDATLLCASVVASDASYKAIRVPERCATYAQWLAESDARAAPGPLASPDAGADMPVATASTSTETADGCSVHGARRTLDLSWLGLLAACVGPLARRRSHHLNP
jgi:hypothetical protein